MAFKYLTPENKGKWRNKFSCQIHNIRINYITMPTKVIPHLRVHLKSFYQVLLIKLLNTLQRTNKTLILFWTHHLPFCFHFKEMLQHAWSTDTKNIISIHKHWIIFTPTMAVNFLLWLQYFCLSLALQNTEIRVHGPQRWSQVLVHNLLLMIITCSKQSRPTSVIHTAVEIHKSLLILILLMH